MKAPRLGDLVEITWLDSAEGQGWYYEDTLLKPKLLVTRSTVIDLSPTTISVASTISADGPKYGVLSPLTIPRGCIIKVKRL